MFVPDGPSLDYVKRYYRKLTKKQFTAKMGSYACRQVVPVDEKPSQLLALADCADTAVDTEDVQLQDGMQLAMVVGAEGASKKIEKSVRGSLCSYRHSTGLFIYFVERVQPICTPHTCMPAVGGQRLRLAVRAC